MAVTRSTLALNRRLRAGIGTETDDADRHLTTQWVTAWDKLAPAWERAATQLAALAVKAGRWPTVHQIARNDAAMNALDASQAALTALAADTDRTASAGAGRIIELDAELEPRIIGSQAPDTKAEALTAHVLRRLAEAEEEPDVTDGGMVPPPTAADLLGPAIIAGIVAGRFEPSALAAIIARASGQIHADTIPLSDDAVAAMRAALIEGIIVGDNPIPVARDMVARVEGAFNGGLTRALTISRTEMLDAYRAASAYIHRANADLVTAWQWYARLDSRTCFPAGTLVRTQRGEIPIETVNVGDTVLTHKNRWRHVYETTSRAYDGRLVRVEAGNLRVTATADHPFLIERDGRLAWIAAGDIRVGDSVLSDRETSGDQGGHVLGEVAIEGCGHEPHHGEAALGKEGILAGVAVSDPVVPVGLIDFEGDVWSGQDEIHRTHPALDGGLLDVGQAERFKSETDVPFRDGLPGVATVAAHRAEPLMAHRGLNAELLAAGQTVVEDGRASAGLTAMASVLTPLPESLAAASAVTVSGVGGLARDGADEVSGGVRSGDREGLPAAGADLGDGLCGCAAGGSAELAGSTARGHEDGAAVGAGALDLRLSGSAAAPVGVGALVGLVADPRAELSSTGPNPCLGGIEASATHLASPLHRIRVSATYDIPAVLRVHNLEVEGDHSYIAEGFAVHNCVACWSRHGRTYAVTEPGPDDHPRGRCTRLPKLASWAELGISVPEPPSLLPDGEKAFNQLSKSAQLDVMGPGRLELYKSGAVTWDQLATWRDTPQWRRSNQPTTVRDLRVLADRNQQQQEVHRVA
jgi:hypothetical protein